MNSTCPSLSRAGLVLGMQQTVVKPPATAAAEPEATVSSSSSPGSRKWTWMSMRPGVTYMPLASMTRSAGPRLCPTAATLPSRRSTSARRSNAPEGSRTVPFWMRSVGICFDGVRRAESAKARRREENAKGGLERVDHAPNSVLQHHDVEVDQEAQLEIGQTQVRYYLRPVYRRQGLDRLQFHNELAADKDVDPPFTHRLAFVEDRHTDFTSMGYATEVQLMRQGKLVGVLGQSRPELLVDLDRGTNHRGRQVLGLIIHARFLAPAKVEDVHDPRSFSSRFLRFFAPSRSPPVPHIPTHPACVTR